MMPAGTVVTFAAVGLGAALLHPQGDKLTVTRKEEGRIFLSRIGRQDLYDSSFYPAEFDAAGFTAA